MKLKLKAIRVNLGLSQEEMASKLGINTRRYYNLERRAVRMLAEEFVSIHDVLGIAWDDIQI